MSTTPPNFPESSPSPGPGAPGPNPDDQPKSSSLYLFTFLSTLFLLLLVSTAIVLRSFLLRRRYRMGLREQFDDILHHPGDRPVASRRKTFGAKPRLWDAWITQEEGKDTVNEFAEIKPLAAIYVSPQTTKSKNLSSASPVPHSGQGRRHEQSSTFLAGLFTHTIPSSREILENDRPEVGSADSSAEIPRTIQVSVVISMPTPNRKKPPILDSTEEEFPNVAIGFARLPISNE